MLKASLEFNGKEFKRLYITDPKEATAVLNKMSGKKLYGLDIETAKIGEDREYGPQPGLDPILSRIRLVQVYDGESVAVIDLFSATIPAIYRFLKEHRFVAHNALFEISHVVVPTIDCSMIAAQLVDAAEHSPYEPEEDEEEKADGGSQYRRLKGFSLDACVQKYFGVKVGKELQTSNWNNTELTKDQINYAALDAVLTYELFDLLKPKIKEHKIERAYELARQVQYPVRIMQLNGTGIDIQKLGGLIKEWENEKSKTQEQCNRFFEGINLRSSKQLGEWLEKNRSEEDCRNWPRTPTGRYTFTKSKLAKHIDEPEIQALLGFKQWDKLLTTYGDGLIRDVHPITHRIHGSFSIGRTRTGRLSSFRPNLQNIPRDSEIRRCFVSNPGRSFVIGDFSQIELRVAGQLSGDETIKRAASKGIDLHKLIVADVIGKDYGEVTKAERQMGKAINFGFLFGMGPKKLVDYAKLSYGADITEAQAQRAYKVFHEKRYKTYSRWADEQRKACEYKGYVRTPIGRKRKLAEGEAYTKSVNHPVQGGAAEVCMMALLAVYHGLKGDGELINCVHDEIIIECRDDKVERCKHVLEMSMCFGYRHIFKDADTTGLCEIGVGKSWGEAKG